MADVAQYAIDIAAKMVGGEQTTAELDALTAKLMGSGKGAEHFQTAIARLSDDLMASKANTQAQAQALAGAREEYKVLEQAADAAAKAAEAAAEEGAVSPELIANLDAAKAAVKDYGTTLKALRADSQAAKAAVAAGSAEFASAKDALAALQKQADAASLAKVVPPELAARVTLAEAAVRRTQAALEGLGSAADTSSAEAVAAMAQAATDYGAAQQALQAAQAAAIEGTVAGAVPPGLAAELAAAQASVDACASSLDTLKARSEAAGAALQAGKDQLAALKKASADASAAVKDAAAANAGVVPPEMQARLDEANRALANHVVVLGSLEKGAEAAAKKELALGASLGNVKKLGAHVDKTLGQNAEKLAKVQGALGMVGGPLGRIGQALIAPVKGFADLSQVMGASSAACTVAVVGIAAVAAVVVVLAAAMVAGVAAIAAWAVGLADAARSADLTREAAEAMTPTLGPLRDAFAEIEGATGANAAALRGWEKQLRDAKVSAADMPRALMAVATAEKALGQGGSSEFVADIKAGRLEVSKFANDVETKLGGVVARQMLGVEAQSARLKSNLGRLFGGLDIEPALYGMQTLVGLFDETTIVGKVVQKIFETVFQPLINQAENAAYVIEAFAIGFLIGLTKMYIAAKPAIKWIGELFGFEDTSLADVLTAAKNAGELFAKAFVVGGVVLGVVLGAVTLVVGAIVALNVAVMAIAAAFVYFSVKAVAGVVSFFQSLPGYISQGAQLFSDFGPLITTMIGEAVAGMVTAGGDLIAGLAQGISGAGGRVLSAITGVVGGAIDQAKSMLGIASPSKVFGEIGDNTVAGYEKAVVAETPKAQAAVAEMVAPDEAMLRAAPAVALPQVAAANDPPAMIQLDRASAGGRPQAPPPGPGSAQPPAPSGGGGVSLTVDLSNAVFNLSGGAAPADFKDQITEIFTEILEHEAEKLGGKGKAA